MTQGWARKVEEYCSKYNIPMLYLTDTMYEPKVIPMIRGKAFEFSVMLALQAVLREEDWVVSKPVMNAQQGLHDVDVEVVHKSTGRVIRVECKLAKKEGFRALEDHSQIKVKCMRSRTLGERRVRDLAPRWGVSTEALGVHNDQYLPANFDVVISSIGNAFYRTDTETGIFEWRPTPSEEQFLRNLNPPSNLALKDFAFGKLYLARSQDLAVTRESGVVCTRRGCTNRNSCGFVPNNPIIRFNRGSTTPSNAWVGVEESSAFFRGFVAE